MATTSSALQIDLPPIPPRPAATASAAAWTAWALALDRAKQIIVQGGLWQHMNEHHGAGSNAIVRVRGVDGMALLVEWRGLRWEARWIDVIDIEVCAAAAGS